MKKIVLSLLFAFIFLSINVSNAAENIDFQVEENEESRSIFYEVKKVNISTGQKKVKVINVDPKDTGIEFEVNLPNQRLNTTEIFETQVKNKGAFAAINANFFHSYSEIKDPIGHVMIDGRLVNLDNGLITVSITNDKDIIFSTPPTYIAVEVGNEEEKSSWEICDVNLPTQTVHSNILYTPARGNTFKVTADGYVAIVENNVIIDNYFAQVDMNVWIPSNGYVIFTGKERVDDNDLFKIGHSIKYREALTTERYGENTFKWEDMKYALSGGPNLIENGKICPATTLTAFQGKRFNEMSTPRTAIGITKEGRLLLVSVSSAKINELKEIMICLGADQAINLDGGGSTAMYYDGKVIAKPGRKLTTILYVYKQ